MTVILQSCYKKISLREMKCIAIVALHLKVTPLVMCDSLMVEQAT